MTWHPADDELDALARTLPVPDRAADRVEQERTSVLAQAAGLGQLRRTSRVSLVAGVAMAFAAAAAVLIWVIARPTAEPKEQISALGPAYFERIGGWPDFVVRIDDGRVAVRVAKLAEQERFRAVTTDAEVEVRGTRFEVAADHGHITAVAVTEGRVEVRWQHEPPVFLAAGETWSPPRVVERDVVVPAQPQPPAAPMQIATAPALTDAAAAHTAAEPTPAPKVAASAPSTRPAAVRAPSAGSIAAPHASEAKASANVTTSTPAAGDVAPGKPQEPVAQPAVAAPRPGEAEFRAGVASLRAGDAAAATRSFASACQAAQHEALGEDACFWLGAAAKRAGDTATARDALTRFLSAFPSSPRAGEASALLGWILYDAGELDAAEKRFALAAKDRVAKVKESAQRGLEAIARTRASR